MTFERAAELAFSGRLSAARSALERGGSSIKPHDRAWLGAYLAAARGDFDVAERGARALVDQRALGRDARARAAVTLGSILRQTGRHAEARDVERAALARGPRSELRTHLLIGLAADSVGLADLRGVDAAIARIGAGPPGGWRAGVRLNWVRCERELLAGRPSAAALRARRAVSLSQRKAAGRHEAKSFLFLGAALLEVGSGGTSSDTAGALGALRRARTIADRIGARPIAEVAGAMLGRYERRR